MAEGCRGSTRGSSSRRPMTSGRPWCAAMATAEEPRAVASSRRFLARRRAASTPAWPRCTASARGLAPVAWLQRFTSQRGSAARSAATAAWPSCPGNSNNKTNEIKGWRAGGGTREDEGENGRVREHPNQ